MNTSSGKLGKIPGRGVRERAQLLRIERQRPEPRLVATAPAPFARRDEQRVEPELALQLADGPIAELLERERDRDYVLLEQRELVHDPLVGVLAQQADAHPRRDPGVPQAPADRPHVGVQLWVRRLDERALHVSQQALAGQLRQTVHEPAQTLPADVDGCGAGHQRSSPAPAMTLWSRW